MTPHFECESGPKGLKGIPWYPHKPGSEEAKKYHAEIAAMAKAQGATFIEKGDDKGPPCKTLPNRYGP